MKKHAVLLHSNPSIKEEIVLFHPQEREPTRIECRKTKLVAVPCISGIRERLAT
jgi:hypothetical protein